MADGKKIYRMGAAAVGPNQRWAEADTGGTDVDCFEFGYLHAMNR